MIVVCVGSKNPSKIRGVERAFRDMLGDVDVKSYAIEGLTAQPIGLEIVVNSARHRARKVMEIGSGCDYCVGVEAGFIEVKGVGFYDVHAACIIGRGGREFYGFSPAFMVPTLFVEKILSGEYRELEEIVDRYFGTENIGEKGGFISLLTKGRVIREDLVYHSVVAALIPIVNRELYAD